MSSQVKPNSCRGGFELIETAVSIQRNVFGGKARILAIAEF